MTELKGGPELDRIVAEKLFNQTDFAHLPAKYQEGVTEDGEDGWSGWYCPRCGASPNDETPCVKHYSTDIAAAWNEVVVKGIFDRECDITMRADTKGAEVLIYDDEFYLIGRAEIEDDTNAIPLAICLAALKAVEALG